MSVARLERTVTTADAIELIWERVLTGEFSGPAEAARALWPSLSFDSNSLDVLALEGLIQFAVDEKGYATRAKDGGRPAVGFGAPHGKKWGKYVALTWPYEGADGQQKSLLDFSRDDLAAFAAHAGVFVQAWERRRDWAVRADELCKEHEVSRIRDLPPAALAEVNEAAHEAMGRQA